MGFHMPMEYKLGFPLQLTTSTTQHIKKFYFMIPLLNLKWHGYLQSQLNYEFHLPLERNVSMTIHNRDFVLETLNYGWNFVYQHPHFSTPTSSLRSNIIPFYLHNIHMSKYPAYRWNANSINWKHQSNINISFIMPDMPIQKKQQNH